MPKGVYKRNPTGKPASNFVDITGQRFGKWIVLAKDRYAPEKCCTNWFCRCDCGTESSVSGNHLRKGRSTQCLKCAGKQISDKAYERNAGKYTKNRRTFHTIKSVKSLHDSQRGLCAICGRSLPELEKCAWDHDHLTGAGRSLLHRGCNVFLGYIERDSSMLRRVVEYCKKYDIRTDG